MKGFKRLDDGTMIYVCEHCCTEVLLNDEVCPLCGNDITKLTENLGPDETASVNPEVYYCSDCGFEVVNEDKVCPNCGADITEMEAEPAGFWIRVCASLIDALIMLPVVIFALLNTIYLRSSLIFILLTLPGLIYKPFMESKYGATIGKKKMGIKVTDAAGSNLSIVRAYIRFFPDLLQIGISSTYTYLLIFQAIDLKQIQIYPVVSELITYFGLVDILFVVLSKQKRAIHDYMAKSYCVKA